MNNIEINYIINPIW